MEKNSKDFITVVSPSKWPKEGFWEETGNKLRQQGRVDIRGTRVLERTRAARTGWAEPGAGRGQLEGRRGIWATLEGLDLV